MNVHALHDWDVTPQAAIAIQQELAGQVIHDQPLAVESISTVAGVDVSVKDNISRAAVVVLRYPDLTVLETVTARMPTPFPYIPGLLSFREGPVLVDAFHKLRHQPDVFIFDGMGRIHPRKLGIAAHMGLWLDRPTIGCGKNHLVGDYIEPDTAKGSASPLTYKGENLGVILRTRTNVKPVYISPGHRLDIPSAVEITLRVTPKYRLPEPIRAAHNAAGDF
jgi:deoxyribonuclease V